MMAAVSSPRRRAEFFVDPQRDRTYSGPATGDERTLLLDFLAAGRATVALKCRGLEDELTRRSVPPSTLSLLGLIRHLAEVERRWFRRVLAGQDAPPLFVSPAHPDRDFDGALPDPAVIAEAWRVWAVEQEFAAAFIAAAPDLDVVGQDEWRGTVSLRWVLLHLIREYARHSGHADLLRERIDGAVGL